MSTTQPFVLLEYYVTSTPSFSYRILPNQPEFESLLSVPVSDLNVQLDKIKLTRSTVGTVFISNDYTFLAGDTVYFNTLEGLTIKDGPLPIINGLTEEVKEKIDYLVKYKYLSKNPADPADEEYGPDLARDLVDKFSIFGYGVDWDVLIPKTVVPDEITMKAGSFVAELLDKYPCPKDEEYGFHIDHKTWTQLIYARAKKRNVLLVGPTGTGKTETIDVVAKVMGEPVFIQDMGTIMDAQSSLLGVHRIDEHGHSVFDPAPFVDYIKSGNIVLGDEINR